MKPFTWDETLPHIRIGVYLLTATAQSLVYRDRQAVVAIGKAAFGPNAPDAGSVVGEVTDVADLEGYDISNTALYLAARACFEMLEDTTTPINQVDCDTMEDEYSNPLGYFLQAMPRDTYLAPIGGDDFTHLFIENVGNERPLPSLHLRAAAKINLARYLSGNLDLEYSIGFAPFEIASLAGMSIASARNKMGPNSKHIRSVQTLGRESYGDTLDTLEWLAGRANFNPGPLTKAWFEQNCTSDGQKVIGAIVGVYAWVNRITTAELSKKSGVTVANISAWTRGDLSGSIEMASKLALAAGVDAKLYVDAVSRVLNTSLKQ
nr:helix-turn-helix transcriptional regulator [uncultured Devosia sp.]